MLKLLLNLGMLGDFSLYFTDRGPVVLEDICTLPMTLGHKFILSKTPLIIPLVQNKHQGNQPNHT